MVLYVVSDDALRPVQETTFASEKLFERRDIQRLIKANIAALDPDLMVIAEEYGDWEDSGRRIDLLCIDKQGQLVVVELKRTEDGGHMELQAIRYAAMVSSMSFDQLVTAHARYLKEEDARTNAEGAILRFLGWETPEEKSLSDDVRIILVSANFSIELTTAVLWLNDRDLDITCFRMRPYRLQDQVLIDFQQIIPLPEADDYVTKIKVHKQEARKAKSARHEIFRRFWTQLIERSRSKTSLVANRTASSDHWLGAGIGRRGFALNFTLARESSRVELYIDLGNGEDERTIAAYKALEADRAQIDASFGKPLDWKALEESRSCRVCHTLIGGWKSPESEWPELQDRLIDEMVRLEAVMKPAVQRLKV